MASKKPNSTDLRSGKVKTVPSFPHKNPYKSQEAKGLLQSSEPNLAGDRVQITQNHQHWYLMIPTEKSVAWFATDLQRLLSQRL